MTIHNMVLEDVTEAALRPMGPPGHTFWLLAGLLALPVALGAAAYVYQLINGLGVTGLSDQVF